MRPDTGKPHKRIDLLIKELNDKSLYGLSDMSISWVPND